jgi:uncharacterized protein YkwD
MLLLGIIFILSNKKYMTKKILVLLVLNICFGTVIFAQHSKPYKKRIPREQNITPSVMPSKAMPPIPETNDIQQDMLTAVNNLRARGCKCGGRSMRPVSALIWSDKLAAAAQIHADDMNRGNFMNHQGSDGSTFVQRIEKQGYHWRELGENISKGGSNLQAAMQSWLESAGHCEQMMSPSIREMGAARNGKCWVQTFGTPQ